MASIARRPCTEAIKTGTRFNVITAFGGISRRTLGTDGASQRQRPRVRWLDLRGSGLSVLERLLVEEVLWKRQDTGSWIIVGHHDPADHRYLTAKSAAVPAEVEPQRFDSDPLNDPTNKNAVIVMGIGGKPQKLLDVDLVRRDRVPVIRRFSGGGTVVLDSDSIWTTFIGRNDDDDDSDSPPLLPRDQRYPRQIMEWSMSIFGPLVEGLGQRQQEKAKHGPSSQPLDGLRKTMILDTKSCAAENTGRVVRIPIPPSNRELTGTTTSGDRNGLLSLREHDYVLGEARKVAGNAQSVGKSGWLHHTSWLWDVSWDNMSYLSLPDRRPEYRDDRSHADFLTTLRDNYPHLSKRDFYACLKSVVDEMFDVTPVTLPSVMKLIHEEHGDLNQLLSTSRTRVVHDFDR